MGMSIDPVANAANAARIELAGSKPICIVAADEEIMICKLCLK
jgi:hypothetical protein